MKRVFALLLCLCMVFAMVPAASAQTGNVCLSHGETTTYYDTVEAALDEAVEGSRIYLLTNVTAGQVIVKPGVLLDLNGFALTADLVVAADGSIYDESNGAGKVIVKKENFAVVGSDNGQLPLWNPEDNCYIFADVNYQHMLNLAEDKSYAQYIFIPNFSGKALELLKDGSQDNGVSVKVFLSWKDGTSQQFYTFSDEMVAQVYGSANANGTLGKVFQLTVTGIAGIEDMNVCALVVSDTGTEIYSEKKDITGHIYGELILQQNATCEAPGLKEHYTCAACNKYFDADKNEIAYEALILPAAGHTYGDLIPGVAADWKVTGLEAHYKCAVCSKYFTTGKVEVSYDQLVIPALTEPKTGSTLTVADAIALGATKVNNTYTTGKYYVTGEITEVYNTTYGNMRIKDTAGNILTIYGTYNADGSTRYNAMDVKPVAGDTVTVYGIIGQYGGAPQMKNGWITGHIPSATDPAAGSKLTVEQAIALGASKAHNNYTSGKYYVTGEITEVYNVQYGNMRITDENGNILTVYGSYSADGKTRYDAMSVKPVAGDTVTLYGVIGQYNGAPQMKNGWITEHIPYVPAPEPEPEPDTLVVPTCDCVADANQDDICDNCQKHIHRYTLIVTAPNCTQEGYTTYVCVCQDSYVADRIPVSGKHVDANKDKLCDGCGLSVIVELDFYSVNDLHGAFMDTDAHPGVDEFTTYMKQKYQDDSTYEILLSAGDMWQGSVESSSNKGALMTEWMNELDFVSMTIGNHEYDWGSSYIAQNKAVAEFPFLGINVRENGKMPDYCQSSTIVERGGVKIGIIGAMGNHVSSISGEFNQNLQFLSGATLTTLVKNESTRLRQQEDCDLIVYVIHSDDEDYDVALSDGYVDLVFEAHTHQSYINTDSYGVVHMQSGSYNEAVSFVNIAYNLAEDSYVVETKTELSNSVYGKSSIADDPFVAQVYKTYFPGDDPYTTVLGRNAAYRSKAVISQEIANQYLAFGQEHWSEYDIVLAGGSLNLREPYKLYAGNVTYAQLFSLMPFDNSLVLGKISGSKLKTKFLNSSSYYIAQSDSMPTISDSKTYYIIVDTYTAYYASNGITIVDRYDNYYARDLIADFVKMGGWS